MDCSREELFAYKGRHINHLPTPSLIVSKPVIEKNCERLLKDVKEKGIGLRAHVKTLKCLQVTRLMLGNGAHKKAVASTLREIRGLLPLVEEGNLEEILYGIPVPPHALPQLAKLSQQISPKAKILLMVDNPSQITALESFAKQQTETRPWSAFIKVDMGSHRAGLEPGSPALKELIQQVEKSDVVEIYGFYCHAGHSYGSRSVEAAAEFLHQEVSAAVEAAELLLQLRGNEKKTDIVLSAGATPTAHVVRKLQKTLPPGCRMELHGGNYPANDLQQLGTTSVNESDQAVRVLAEVCGVYSARNEAMLNAGVIALSREPGPLEGFARLKDVSGWNVGRLSQEHGIVVRDKDVSEGNVEDVLKIGDKVQLWVQHACITSSAYGWYFVVDEADNVIDVWYPWRGW
ncbi:MAG: hypothetical protein M1834_007542 [Cirrosporium novae-zelandiae]|nr:MAG: hypothetical protein M1834_007542 [Cirrosporium novae-zelandiae]